MAIKQAADYSRCLFDAGIGANHQQVSRLVGTVWPVVPLNFKLSSKKFSIWAP